MCDRTLRSARSSAALELRGRPAGRIAAMATVRARRVRRNTLEWFVAAIPGCDSSAQASLRRTPSAATAPRPAQSRPVSVTGAAAVCEAAGRFPPSSRRRGRWRGELAVCGRDVAARHDERGARARRQQIEVSQFHGVRGACCGVRGLHMGCVRAGGRGRQRATARASRGNQSEHRKKSKSSHSDRPLLRGEGRAYDHWSNKRARPRPCNAARRNGAISSRAADIRAEVERRARRSTEK